MSELSTNKDGVDGAADPTAKVAAIEREETLEAENLSLRLTNLCYRETLLRHELKELVECRQRKQQELEAFRQMLARKYNVDFEFNIEAGTGCIVPIRRKG